MNTTHTQNQSWAALDLGSNSFHMMIVQPRGEGFTVRERLKEKVQLAAGLGGGEMQRDAQQRGLVCLARFAQRLTELEPARIFVMGTCALREAPNATAFTEAAQRILGVPVEVVSGELEAQLIYRGVDHYIGRSGEPRLVIDIGGGSTEFALGDAGIAATTASVNIGCVAWKDRYFDASQGQFEYQQAKQAAVELLQRELHASNAGLKGVAQAVYGTSGTIESIAHVLAANGWSNGDITREGLNRLENAVAQDSWVLQTGFPGLAPDRVDIFPAGVAILSACFEVLALECLHYVDVSLLQGIICEKILKQPLPSDTQRQAVDIKEDSIAHLAQRFAVDQPQANRVAKCAARLYQLSDDWWSSDTEFAALLRWAALLHELGVHISARHYHRHGAYIIKHAELAGFSQYQQSVLALLVRGHRRSMPGLAFRAFDPEQEVKLLRLVALLRIAVILQRSHSDEDPPQIGLQVGDQSMALSCGEGWLERHPMSLKELRVECDQQASVGLDLVIET